MFTSQLLSSVLYMPTRPVIVFYSIILTVNQVSGYYKYQNNYLKSTRFNLPSPYTPLSHQTASVPPKIKYPICCFVVLILGSASALLMLKAKTVNVSFVPKFPAARKLRRESAVSFFIWFVWGLEWHSSGDRGLRWHREVIGIIKTNFYNAGMTEKE